MKKIDVYINGKYAFTSTRYKTQKEFKMFLSSVGFVFVAGRGLVELYNKKISTRLSIN